MIGAHPVRHIRAAEAALMATLPPGALMQRAAAGLAARCALLLGGPYGARVTLLVGAGDNGGDALFAGARLARRGAWVDAILIRPERAHPDGLAALRGAGGVVTDWPVRSVAAADLVVDGLLGIGGSGGLRNDAAQLVQLAAERAGLVISVDLPSGVDADTGELPGEHVVADVTVTFGTRKVALLVDPAAAAAGRVEDVDIGLASYLPKPPVEMLERDDVRSRLPVPARDADKYARGVVGVVAGSAEFSGAAVLSTGGAVRGGAGMVRYVGPDAVVRAVQSRWPETVAGSGRVQAWVVGPGMGSDPAGGRMLGKALSDGVPLVVDADGLRFLPQRLDVPALLTPHAGELARMLDTTREDVEARRLRHARDAAARWNAVVLLKGSTTLVVAPDGRVRVNPTGTPVLATAGSGDVLAGLAGALMGAGLDPLDAGSVAAYAHGVAGQLATRSTPYPSATTILDLLPDALRQLIETAG
ncbi:MAG TPA: NAD(P)H-hydrate dehydratase [Jiangellaceae bacterium]|nr:NAD(P)H-hydrate dehydratase [Jiangellaceae bacterium]